MAVREIDELEYAELKRVEQVAKLIGGNPKAREMLQQAVALAAPEQAGPEIRIRQEVTEKLSGIEKMLADDRAERAKEKEERDASDQRHALETRWSQSRAKARDAGYTDEGLTELEAFMEKNGVADHELAIPAFERLHPPPEPVVSGGSRWNFFDQQAVNGDAVLKSFMDSGGQNDEAFLGAMIPAALKEVRGR
jgi:hypothetical protein